MVGKDIEMPIFMVYVLTPFFLEGIEIFQFPDDGLDIVYTRRITDPI
jgi:hypothetical protein